MNWPRITHDGVVYVVVPDHDSAVRNCDGCVADKNNRMCFGLNNTASDAGLGKCGRGDSFKFLSVTDAVVEALRR